MTDVPSIVSASRDAAPVATASGTSRFRRRAIRVGLLLSLGLIVWAAVARFMSVDLTSAVESAGGRYSSVNPYPLLQRAFLAATGNSGRLEKVLFTPGQVNDAWFRRHIKKLRKLNRLQLIMIRTQVTDAGLRELQNAAWIHQLDLRGTQLTDKSVAVFTSLSQLYWLNVAHTGISDTALQPVLAGSVPSLGVDAGQLIDAAAQFLAARTGPLQNLEVYDANKETLKRIQSLNIGQRLTLQGTAINRECIPLIVELVNSRGIRFLSLFDADLTDADRSELAKTIPQCDIYSDSLLGWELMLQRSQPVSSRKLW